MKMLSGSWIVLAALLIQCPAWAAAPVTTPEQSLLEKVVAVSGETVSRNIAEAEIRDAVLAYAGAYLNDSRLDPSLAEENLVEAAERMHLLTPEAQDVAYKMEPSLLQTAREVKAGVERGASAAEIASIQKRFLNEFSSALSSVRANTGAQYNACGAAKTTMYGGLIGLAGSVALGFATGNIDSDLNASSWVKIAVISSWATGYAGWAVLKLKCDY